MLCSELNLIVIVTKVHTKVMLLYIHNHSADVYDIKRGRFPLNIHFCSFNDDQIRIFFSSSLTFTVSQLNVCVLLFSEHGTKL